MKRNSIFILAVGGAVALGSGCATTLRVKVMEPAPVNLGAAKRLSVVQSEGRRSAKEAVIGLIIKQARGDGYFQIADRTEEGITLKAEGRAANVSGGKEAQGADEIYARIDIQGWQADKDEIEHKSTDKDGNKVTTVEKIYKGEVILGVTLAHPNGKAVLAEKEFKGESLLNADRYDKDQAIDAAAANAVYNLLREITPRPVEKDIRMDDDDKGQKEIIEIAKQGNLARAIEEMKKYIEKDANNPAAMYNLAVLLDATGAYKEALDYYTKATSNSTKEYYMNTKAECAKRLAAQEALMQ
jgi:tetratricopeptide (TPR) repeat protein